jgi:hypothetical protein
MMERNAVFGWLLGKRGSAHDGTARAVAPGLPLFSAAAPPLRTRPIAPVVWIPDHEPPQVSLAEAGGDPLELCPATACTLPAALWFSNHGDTEPDRGQHLQQRLYNSRDVAIPPIRLVRLPLDTVVFGGGHFLTACGDCFLAEQFPPGITHDPASIDAIAPFDALPIMERDDEVLLVGRFGMTDWKQWLCELLPKILLAERAFPGRFAFLLPPEILQSPPPAAIWSRIAESLQACGIELSRVLPAAPDTAYRFSALHAVTPIWSDHVIHPHAAEALRDACAYIPAGSHRRLSVQGAKDEANLSNAGEIEAVLQARGFVPLLAAILPFADQVAAFKGASTLFGVLGSDLAGLLFAPPGIRAITAAPDTGTDRMCYGLVLDRQGRMADLRGRKPVFEPSGRTGTFALDPDLLLVALDSIPA